MMNTTLRLPGTISLAILLLYGGACPPNPRNEWEASDATEEEPASAIDTERQSP